MARVPMGKVLLRNVIRHTDAHNKIQEESEMWKMRDMEKQYPGQHRQTPTMSVNRGHMHCDRLEPESRDRFGSQERSSGQDEREARYWTRKLYEFEANDPDRWGHSGFKELYPEEFRIEGEHGGGDKKKHRRKIKSKGSTDTAKTKRSKKSSKKKKKKKEGKKRKRAAESGEESSGEESDSLKGKQRRKRSESKHGRKKRERRRGREEESSPEDSDDEGGRRERTHRKAQRHPHRLGTDSGLEPQKKKRRENWKAANEERSEGSSDD